MKLICFAKKQFCSRSGVGLPYLIKWWRPLQQQKRWPMPAVNWQWSLVNWQWSLVNFRLKLTAWHFWHWGSPLFQIRQGRLPHTKSSREQQFWQLSSDSLTSDSDTAGNLTSDGDTAGNLTSDSYSAGNLTSGSETAGNLTSDSDKADIVMF